MRRMFRSERPESLSATVTAASEKALVRRFKERAGQAGVSVQKLLLKAVKAFLEGPGG